MSKLLFILCAVLFVIAVLAAILHGALGADRYPWLQYVIWVAGGLGVLAVLGGVVLRRLRRP